MRALVFQSALSTFLNFPVRKPVKVAAIGAVPPTNLRIGISWMSHFDCYSALHTFSRLAIEDHRLRIAHDSFRVIKTSTFVSVRRDRNSATGRAAESNSRPGCAGMQLMPSDSDGLQPRPAGCE